MRIHDLFADDCEAPGPGWATCDHPWCGLLKRTDEPCPLEAHHDSMEKERRFNARRGARRMLLYSLELIRNNAEYEAHVEAQLEAQERRKYLELRQGHISRIGGVPA